MELGRVLRSIDTTYTVILPERIYEGNPVEVEEDTTAEYIQTYEVEFVEKNVHSSRVAARATITLPNKKNPDGKAVLVVSPDSLNVKGQKDKETITVQYKPSWFERTWLWLKSTGYLTIAFFIVVGIFTLIAVLRK